MSVSITGSGALEWTYVFAARVGWALADGRDSRKEAASGEVGRERKAAVRAETALSSMWEATPCCDKASLSARGMSSLKGLYSSIDLPSAVISPRTQG